MKNLILILFIFFLFSFKNGVDNTNCIRTVSFGDINICLPIIDGLKECYLYPRVKYIVDENDGSQILGYYINNSTFKQVDRLDKIIYDDYVSINAPIASKGIKIGQMELNQFKRMAEQNYIKKNWSDIKNRIEENFNATLGAPILIDSYSPNEKVRTFIIMTKILFGENEIVRLMSLNMIEIKNRLVNLVYYKDYEGLESIKKLKSKNDYMVLLLLEENK